MGKPVKQAVRAVKGWSPQRIMQTALGAASEVALDPRVLVSINKYFDPATNCFVYIFFPKGETRFGLELARFEKKATLRANTVEEITVLKKLLEQPLSYDELAAQAYVH